MSLMDSYICMRKEKRNLGRNLPQLYSTMHFELWSLENLELTDLANWVGINIQGCNYTYFSMLKLQV